MPSAGSVEVSAQTLGAEHVDKMLRALGDPKAARRIVNKGLKEAAEPILHQARANCPIDTGKLVRSLGTWQRKRGDTAMRHVGVLPKAIEGTPRKDGKGTWWYPAHVELGYQRGKTQIPGNPYLRDASKTREKQALAIFMRVVGKGIERIARRRVRKK